MATLLEHAINVSAAFPSQEPVFLGALANVFWPDADWLRARVNRHNGGARRGARVAGAMAGKLEKAGYLRMSSDLPRSYLIRHDATAQAAAARQ